MAFNEGEQAYIIENNSRVTPVRIIRKDGDFYTIEFSDYGRINLRASRLFHTREEAEGKIRTSLMLGLVFIETVAIYALIVAILIVFVL